jgi:hypothetical protein
MKTAILIATAALALAGCASTQSIPAGMKAGEFVSYNCDGGKRLMARAAADGSTVRVRYEGGYELDRKGDGVYEGEGWKLMTQGAGTELVHNGKTVLKNCKIA